jgi:DnaJ-class molecular chaperone
VITRKNAVLWLIVAGLFAYKAPPVVSLAIGFVAFVGYLLSIQFHPHRNCRSCSGTGRRSGAVWAWGNRMCGLCGGQGRQRRWGAQFFHRNSQVRAEARAGAASQRRGKLL